MLIETRNLTKRYQLGSVEVEALRGIDIEVDKGEYVALTGQSGSGKSTLMHLMGCLDTPTEGTYRLDGRDVSAMADAELARVRNRQIGFVFQTFNLLSRATALHNVEMPLIYGNIRSSERRRRAEEALERAGLGDRMQHKPNELSGGERQRVAIARALVVGPSILLADEPTGNLDTTTGSEIMKLFDLLSAEGQTIILVTHEREIARHARRHVVMRDGLIESDSSSAEAPDG